MALEMANVYQWAGRPLQGAESLHVWFKKHEKALTQENISHGVPAPRNSGDGRW